MKYQNGKYWQKLDKYDSFANDVDNLSKFTPDEKVWLNQNLEIQDIKDVLLFVNHNPYNGYVIVLKKKPPPSWYLTKYEDDWYYCANEVAFCNPDDGDIIYKCDSFFGLKKLLKELDLVIK